MEGNSLNNLLLIEIFERLRRPLGLTTDSYLTALKALKAGYGLSNFLDFKNLCCTVWAKSFQDIKTIEEAFAHLQKEPEGLKTNAYNKSSLSSVDQDENDPDYPAPDDEDNTKETSSRNVQEVTKDDLLPPPEENNETSEPTRIVQAIRQSLESLRNEGKAAKRKWLVCEYFPATHQEMTKSWLRMQKSENKHLFENIDIESTVQKTSEQGFLLKPLFIKSFYRVELVFLLDWKGSMSPFHGLCEQLIETAEKGGQFRAVNAHYFYNWPEHFLFSGPSRKNATKVSDLLKSFSDRTVVLIVSDAGAARGRLNSKRVEKTRHFIHQLQQTSSSYAWLNPMPAERWLGNSAGKISQFVNMLSMSTFALDRIARLVRRD